MKKVMMMCTKTLLICTFIALGTMTANAATNTQLQAPEAYRFSSTLPADASASIESERAALENQLEALKAEMAQAKLDGRNYDELIALAREIRNDLGMKNDRPFGDYTPSLDEGGESCTSATLITGLPFADVGNTCDNVDDDNTDCANSGGPDVFYTFTPTADIEVRLSTCFPGTDFDTVLKIRDSAGNIVACNDDIGNNPACLLPTGQYWRSTIDCVQLNADERYCIIVDGFGWTEGSDNYPLRCGNYQLVIEECSCALCPIGGGREGESECFTGYVDVFNVGCNYTESGLNEPVYSPINCGDVICGTSGNFTDAAGLAFRDTDWYLLSLTEETRVNFCVTAEFNSFVAIVDVTNGCPDPLVGIATANGAECEEVCINECLPAGEYALFVSTAGFTGYPCGTPYVATLECGPCGQDCFPEPPFLAVTVGPDQQLPYYECLFICPNDSTEVCVGPGLGPNQEPVVNLLPGCDYTAFPGCLVPECPPAIPQMGSWIYDPTNGTWCNFIVAAPGTAPGCVCFSLERILPVELVGFDAIAGDREVTLNWSTASETDNDHFDILRDGTVVGRVTAQNSATGSHYSWTDANLNNGRVYDYTLVSVSINGDAEEIATASATPSGSNVATVTEYALYQNYPNPFNPETNITFDLVETGAVKLTIYNATGQTVATLANGPLSAGRHSVTFEAAAMPSGLYFYRLEAGDFNAVRKMVLMK